MRNIPDEFLGALFGAWVGIATTIWNEPIWKSILFIGSLVLIAILLDVVAGPFKNYVRAVAGIILFSIALAVGVVFTWAPGFVIFSSSSQVGFFWILLTAWLTVGVIPTLVTRWLPAEQGN